MNKRTKLFGAGLLAGAAALTLWLCPRAPHAPSRVSSAPSPSAAPISHKTPAPAKLIVTEKRQSRAPTAIPVWQHRIDALLDSPVDESQTAQLLIGMFPNLPSEGQVQAAHHIANLLADGDYDKVKPILLNPSTDKEALDVLYSDLMNRPDAAKMRTLLDLAKLQNHPLSEEAQGTLQVLLGEDHGSDWAIWNSAIDAYVANSDGQ